MFEPAPSQPEVVFPDHFGFCEGVVAADDLLRDVAIQARLRGIDRVYGYHDVVHNRDVVAEHEANGVVFVDDIDAIPPESVVVTSAHGVGPEVVYALEDRGSLVFDAACPLVLHTHKGVERARQSSEKVIYICHGKPGSVNKLHDEVQGMVGHLDYVIRDGELIEEPVERSFIELHEDPALVEDLLDANGRYRIVSQTTLHAEDTFKYRHILKAHILNLQPEAQVSWSNPGDVCRAVTNRQKGVNQLIQLSPRRIVVVTDPMSKNGRSYVDMAERRVKEEGLATEVVAVANAAEATRLSEIAGLTGITASASTPDRTTMAVARQLGLTQEPDIERKKFGLKDARGSTIQDRLGIFAARLATSS